jgi:hypothetical protein
MMRRFAVPALMLLAVLCFSAAGPAADEKAKDEAAIRALAVAFDKSHNNHDAKAFATLFAGGPGCSQPGPGGGIGNGWSRPPGWMTLACREPMATMERL